jgi:hypothetical protein
MSIDRKETNKHKEKISSDIRGYIARTAHSSFSGYKHTHQTHTDISYNRKNASKRLQLNTN